MRWAGGARSRVVAGGAAALAILVMAVPAAAQAQDSAARSRGAWHRTAQRGPAPGQPVAVDPTDFTSFSLDRTALAAEARQAPPAGAGSPVVLSIPKPDGSFARFDVTRGTTLSPELAAQHPDIRDYVGTGVDDPSASLSLVISPEGAYAAIRGSDGTSYVEPRYRDDATMHVAFARQDLPNPAPFHEDEAIARQLETSLPPSALRPGPGDTVPLRTYRLALINDPSYANFFGGSDAEVLAAKTALMARVNQIYRQDLGITMQLIPQTDALNLNTDAEAIQPGGPCGGAACYTAGQLDRCNDPTLIQTTIVLGQIVGARNYDIGHLALGDNGGGLAAAGVGDALKAEGCTGSENPTGDAWGVDFVAHEMGHQFDASHTWNGTRGSCTNANRFAATAVEPGSGSTIMGYAGLCGDDNLQPHTDPYFSQQSQEQIYAWVDAPGDSRERPPLSSVQRVSLRDFNGVDSFDISSGGGQPETITNGTNYTLDGIKAAIEAAIGANKTVTVTNWENQDGGALDENGFTVTYDSDVDEPQLAVSNFSGGASGFVGDAVVGGTRRNGGTETATANGAPTVQTAPGFTIPARTPFTLTAAGSDPNPGDTLTYLWEERDAGNGQTLGTEPGATGPLFRVFGVAQRTDTGAVYNSTPKNATTTNLARDFPDVAQVMADNTDAVKDCGPVAAPTGNDCWSEYLPKVNRTMNFRVTARDGNAQAGGNGFADTVLTVSGGAGPFRLTSQATNTDNGSATTLPVTWDVAGTNTAPINTANVRILLSTDDGATFSTVLAGSTPNDGSEAVPLPAGVQTTTARIRIEGVGNVFYDVSRGQLSFDRTKEPPPSGGGGGGGTSGGGTTTPTSTTTTPTTPPLLPVTPTAPTSASIRLSAAKVQNFLRTGVVTVKVTVDRDAALTATGTIALGRAKPGAAAGLRLKSAKGSATAGKATTLKLRLTQRDKTRLRSAVRARRTATAKISVKVSPTGLPPTTEKSTVRQKGA
jgi:Metallo-peptidase family M12B Reprolysin-like